MNRIAADEELKVPGPFSKWKICVAGDINRRIHSNSKLRSEEAYL